MTSRPVIGRTRIGLLNTMFSASSSPTWAAVGLPDSRSFRKGCIVIPPIGAFQGRMSGRHLKLRVFILHYLRPLRTSAKDTAFQMIALFISSANLIYRLAQDDHDKTLAETLLREPSGPYSCVGDDSGTVECKCRFASFRQHQRAPSRVGVITRGATDRGRSFWRVPSRWTSSPVPPARGG